MTAQMKPESVALLRLLKHGEWRDYEQTLRELTTMVAPGRAIRQWHSVRGRELRVSEEPPEDEKIASGARALAVSTVNSLRRRYVELEYDEFSGRRVRIRRRAEALPIKPRAMYLLPEEVEAGTPPQEPETDPVPQGAAQRAGEDSMALFDEGAIRKIVRGEMEAILSPVLDDFQKGMERFLVNRFAALEEVLGQRLPQRRWPQDRSHKSRDLGI